MVPILTSGFTSHYSATRPGWVSSGRTVLGTIVSPFDDSADSREGYTATDPVELDEGPLELTEENVELVLEEMRPYLIKDGGNVVIDEIDGPVVRLQLQVS